MERLKRVATAAWHFVRRIPTAWRARAARRGERPQAPGRGGTGPWTRALRTVAAVALVGLVYAGVLQWSGLLGIGRGGDPPPPALTGLGLGTDALVGAETGLDGGAARGGEPAASAGDGSGTPGSGMSAPAREPVSAGVGNGPDAPAADRDRPSGLALLDEIALPVAGSVGQPPGWRRHTAHGYWYFEPGVELVAEEPTVYAVLPGRVITTARAAGGGFAVVIDHGDGLVTAYEPLAEVYVAAGQYVSARAPVGRAADTVVFAAFHDDEAVDVAPILNGR